VFGVVPALAVLRGNASAWLKDDSSRGSAGKRTHFTRASLVVVETALALILLVGAGLLIKSFARLQNVNPGFSSEDVLTRSSRCPPRVTPTPTRAGRSGRASSRPPVRSRA
jgi:putative ABC transport system permease protein